MRKSAAFFPIALAVVAIILASRAGAQDGREEGPFEIEKCQTISKPGSYKLVKNLTVATPTECLVITASFVTIDLAGFSITGPGGANGAGVTAPPSSSGQLQGIAVRNGSISGFGAGVDLSGDGSIVEGLRVHGVGAALIGIVATGIVKGNTVVGIEGGPGFEAVGISATGIVTGNYVTGSRTTQYQIGQGSTVIGNTAVGILVVPTVGFLVSCPSNVTDNTAVNNPGGNIVLNGEGCNNTNNAAP